MNEPRPATIVCPLCSGDRACSVCGGSGQFRGLLIRVLPKPRSQGKSRTRSINEPKRKAADREWATAVKDRDGWKCRKCGKVPDTPQGLHAAHVFSRRSANTRHLVANGVTLCYYHHMRWAHEAPAEFIQWVKEELGDQAFHELEIQAHTTQKSVKRRTA